jgi:hypothetical protein
MKCTDNEWKHCQQEKRGCDGCYYDCIPKSKIREKIDEVTAYGFDNVVEVLQELLEEE